MINEFIYLSVAAGETMPNATCVAQQDNSNLYLTYHLSSNDCLFSFAPIANKVELKISKAYFEKYDTPFEIVSEKQQICCNTQSKLYELINCGIKGIARNIYLESMVLYLLFQVQKNNLIFQLNCDTCTFLNKPIDTDKIKKAKTFIVNNLDQNITIATVANFVGTNQCYLKKGFKEVTGQTIFEFLQDNRLTKAKHLLHTSNYTILEISIMVGYASISSFSQSYKNYFGITPSTERKQIIPLY